MSKCMHDDTLDRLRTSRRFGHERNHTRNPMRSRMRDRMRSRTRSRKRTRPNDLAAHANLPATARATAPRRVPTPRWPLGPCSHAVALNIRAARARAWRGTRTEARERKRRDMWTLPAKVSSTSPDVGRLEPMGSEIDAGAAPRATPSPAIREARAMSAPLPIYWPQGSTHRGEHESACNLQLSLSRLGYPE